MIVECKSPAMRRLSEIVERVAPTDLGVLITGESGTGKEIIARQIFAASPRNAFPFIKVNSASIPHNLLESELFGYRKGAFTGASGHRLGRFQAAHRGTLFFDEIAELNTESQAKLLQIIQDGEFSPLGGNETYRVDVRILVATNRDLNGMVEGGGFRKDLYYRLDVVHLKVPPLRERTEDIRPLTEHFLGRFSREFKKVPPSLAPADWDRIESHSWPGNIRELENFIKNLVLLGQVKVAIEGLRSRARRDGGFQKGRGVGTTGSPSLLELSKMAEQEIERRVIAKTLRRNGWNRKKTAQMLQISYRSLLSKIKKLEIA